MRKHCIFTGDINNQGDVFMPIKIVKIYYVPYFLVMFSLFVFSCTGIAGEQGEVKWYSYEAGMDRIEEDGRKGFLYFFTEWCTYCKKADQETFSEKEISDYLNENYVPIRVDADQHGEIARSYGANQFPLNIFLSEDAEVIAGRPGFVPAGDMIHILKYIDTESYETMSFSEFLDQ